VRQARSALRIVGAPLRLVLLGLIRLYRLTLSGMLGGQCKYYPSCSHYAEQAVRERGAVVGGGLAVWRLLRCNPFALGGVDHVPSRGPRSVYEDVTLGASAEREAAA
jgi:putative membrane protein insertion efficiency factor